MKSVDEYEFAMPNEPAVLFGAKLAARTKAAVEVVEGLRLTPQIRQRLAPASPPSPEIVFLQVIDATPLQTNPIAFKAKWETYDPTDNSITLLPDDPDYVNLIFDDGQDPPQAGFSYAAQRCADLPGSGDIPTFRALGTNPNLMVIINVLTDTLTCAPFVVPLSLGVPQPQIYNAGLDSGASHTVAVAKPYSLQQSPWDGQTVTLNGQAVTFAYTGLGQRNASGLDSFGNSITEPQIIVPDYVLGDVIAVFKTGNGYAADYIDLNNAGRAWAMLQTTVDGGSF